MARVYNSEYVKKKFRLYYKKNWIRKHKTEAEFAEAISTNQCHATQQMVSRWYLGKTAPSSEYISQIAKILLIDKADLIGGEYAKKYRQDKRVVSSAVTDVIIPESQKYGVDGSFLHALQTLGLMNRDFPFTTPIFFDTAGEIGHHRRMPVAPAAALSKNIKPGKSDFQVQEESGKALLSAFDMPYLSVLQNDVILFIKEHFKQHQVELNNALMELDKCGYDLTLWEIKGIISPIEASADELNQKDRWVHYESSEYSGIKAAPLSVPETSSLMKTSQK